MYSCWQCHILNSQPLFTIVTLTLIQKEQDIPCEVIKTAQDYNEFDKTKRRERVVIISDGAIQIAF